MNTNFEFIKDGLFGLIIGDIVGVPAEFKSRETLTRLPVLDMQQFGTHFQPKGTWSDDTSMTLGTLDSLCNGYDAEDIMKKFVAFIRNNEYTPWGKVFDAGSATVQAIYRYEKGTPLKNCGGKTVKSNGNGSLMRILPMVYYLLLTLDLSSEEGRAKFITGIHEVSAITHAHPISMIGCGIYGYLVKQLINYKANNLAMDKYLLIHELQEAIDESWADYEKGYGNIYHDKNFTNHLQDYHRLKDLTSFSSLPEDTIESKGYVVYTLEAALWCFLNTDNYRDCILTAVHLGNDTDTVAAVAGSFAGIYYGTNTIPADWMGAVARRKWIEEMIEKFTQTYAH